MSEVTAKKRIEDLEIHDPAENLRDPESQAFVLNDALSEGDSRYIAHALGTVARAHNMSKIAAEAGVTRQSLYHSLSGEADLRLSTFLGVIRSLGLELRVAPASKEPAP